VLIVGGSRDPYCPAEDLVGLSRARPGPTVTVIEGADHFFSSGLASLDAALGGWAAKLAR
jgi:pimeloyl-ACP methyl ester carboxylesterase